MPGENAPELGLIGISAELALSSVLSEIYSEQFLQRPSGMFYTAGECLAALRKVLKNPDQLPPSLGDADLRQKIASAVESSSARFGALFEYRAGAVHTGQGVSRDVCYLLIQDVLGVLDALAASPKWKAYLKHRPEAPPLPKQRELLLEELLKTVRTGNPTKSKDALLSIFLVAPKVSESEPDWIKSLGRAIVVPRRGDLAVLLKSLEDAKVGEIYKVGSSAEAIAARIEQDNPNAISISVGNMKTNPRRPEEVFRSYIGTANRAFNEGYLDLPNIRTIYELIAVLYRNPKLLKKGIDTEFLSAQEVWPVIATALRYQGSPGPVFAIASQLKLGEEGQLAAMLDKASGLKNGFSVRWQTYKNDILYCAKRESTLGDQGKTFEADFIKRRGALDAIVPKLLEALPVNLMSQEVISPIRDFVKSRDFNAAIDRLIHPEAQVIPKLNSVLHKAVRCVSHPNSIPIIVKVLQCENLSSVHSECRKVLQLLDFLAYHPHGRTLLSEGCE